MPGSETAGPAHRPITGEMLEEAQRHLATAGVVHTQEQHHRSTVVTVALDLGQRMQPLPGEPFGDQRQEPRQPALVGELVIAGVQEPFDRCGAEHVRELAFQIDRCRP